MSKGINSSNEQTYTGSEIFDEIAVEIFKDK